MHCSAFEIYYGNNIDISFDAYISVNTYCTKHLVILFGMLNLIVQVASHKNILST